MDVKKGNDGPQSLNIYYGIKANFAKHWQPKRMARVDSVIARGHVDKILSTLPDHRKLALFLFIAHNGAESVIIRPIRNKPVLSENSEWPTCSIITPLMAWRADFISSAGSVDSATRTLRWRCLPNGCVLQIQQESIGCSAVCRLSCAV